MAATTTRPAGASRPAPPPLAPPPPRRTRRAPFPVEFYRSAVGKKVVMALTGVIGLGYLVGHLVGNLKMYLGPEEIDHYGEFLRELLVPLLPRTVTLWLLRTVLIGALILHVHAAYSLTVMNRRARPVRYQSKRDYVAANFASRTMRWSGIIVLLFIVWHLADLTWGWVNPDYVRGAVYRNVDASLSRWWVSLIYIAGVLALGPHLYHGLWSLFQSMGWNNPRFNRWRRNFAAAFAVVLTVGYLSFPIMVLAGVIGD